jgi:hypothetical protein
MNKKVKEMLKILQEIPLESIPNKTCCGVLEAYFRAGFEWPFGKQMMINKKSLDMKVGFWHVNMMPNLSSDKPDSNNRILIALSYCPFCGAKLMSSSNETQT